MNRGLFLHRLLLAGRLIVAGIFLYSGYAKLSEPWLQFVVSLESFKLLPDTVYYSIEASGGSRPSKSQ